MQTRHRTALLLCKWAGHRRVGRGQGVGPRRRVFPATTHSMVRLDNIGKQTGHQTLFIDASTGRQKGEKAGLVGPNGAGAAVVC